jgi:hypothetical protein
MRASLPKIIARSLSVAAVFSVSSSVEAATFVLGASNQGFFNELGQANLREQQGDIGNTFTGNFRSADSTNFVEYRSFYVFDVGISPQPFESITFTVFQERYFSSAVVENVTLFAVDTDATALQQPDLTTSGVSIFEDLGSGTVYGQGTISALPTVENSGTFIGEFLDITLTPAGVDAANQARSGSGLFSVGLAVTSLDDTAFTATSMGEDLGGAEGVRFSTGVDPKDCRAGLLVSLKAHSSQEFDTPCLNPSEPLPKGPQPVPESGMILGTALSLLCGALLRLSFK